MPQVTPATVFVGIVMVLVALLFIAMLVYKAALWYENNMSIRAGQIEDEKSVAPHVGATGNEAGQRIAMRGNGFNEELPGNAWGNADPVFATQLDSCLRLIGTGKVGQTEAIEIAFGCKRSGKPDSPYAKARAAVLARMGQKPEPEWARVNDVRMERAN